MKVLKVLLLFILFYILYFGIFLAVFHYGGYGNYGDNLIEVVKHRIIVFPFVFDTITMLIIYSAKKLIKK